jgi:hypothetical protein
MGLEPTTFCMASERGAAQRRLETNETTLSSGNLPSPFFYVLLHSSS